MIGPIHLTCDCPGLPAKSALVGPLVLYEEMEELTLEVGTKYHCHFAGQGTEECDADPMHAASIFAAEFVDGILQDRIGVAVHYNDRGCIGAELIYLDREGLAPGDLKNSSVGVHGGAIRTERFLWSGPVKNPT